MIIKYLLAKTKKYSNDIILLFVFSFIGLIIGILIHNKIEPKWNVIWDLELDDEVKSSIQNLMNANITLDKYEIYYVNASLKYQYSPDDGN